MACRICGSPLNRYVDLDTGLVEYTHPRNAARGSADHAADPVPADRVDVHHVCDFCGDERIVYTFRTVPIDTVVVCAGEQLVERYGTDWSACVDCAAFIEARDLDGLHARLRRVGPPLDPIGAYGVRVMQQAVLSSLLPGRTLAAIGRWPATVLVASTLPKVRDRLVALVGGPIGLPLGLDTDQVRGQIIAGLAAARLYWVDAQFTDLAQHAAGSLPATTIGAADLPAPHGLLAWAQPVGTRGDLTAASWTTGPDGIRIVGYRSIGAGLPPAQLQQLREQIGWLVPGTHTRLTAGDPVDAGSPAGVLAASWLLIAQRLAETAPVPVDKSIRRAYQRTGRPAPQVRLVRIRGANTIGSDPQQRPAATQASPQREFRWWVRGHWRNQPYGPGRAQRRLIYIDPQIRGPRTNRSRPAPPCGSWPPAPRPTPARRPCPTIQPPAPEPTSLICCRRGVGHSGVTAAVVNAHSGRSAPAQRAFPQRTCGASRGGSLSLNPLPPHRVGGLASDTGGPQRCITWRRSPTLSYLIPTKPGTRVSALISDGGPVLTPGIVVGLEPTPRAGCLRLRVLVRKASGEFHTEEYLVHGSQSAARVRHDYVGSPDAEVRDAWNGLALWDVLEIQAGLRGPQGGDAVRLTMPWHGAVAGDIGVLNGYVAERPERDQGSITFNPRTFRDAATSGRTVVRASGGPASISTPVSKLVATGETVTLTVWRWRPGGPGAGRDEEYTVTVPLWDWTPGAS